MLIVGSFLKGPTYANVVVFLHHGATFDEGIFVTRVFDRGF